MSEQISQIVEIENNFRSACLGIFGTRNLIPNGGVVSDPKYHFVALTATEDSVIDYKKATVQFKTYGEDTVVGFPLPKGMSVVLGVIKDVNVQSGRVIGNLITRP